MDERTESSAPAEVVVGTDGTAPALRAVAWAATEARLRGRALRIVHVASYADTEAGRRHAHGILGRALTAALTLPLRRHKHREPIRFDDIVRPDLRTGSDAILTAKVYRTD